MKSTSLAYWLQHLALVVLICGLSLAACSPCDDCDCDCDSSWFSFSKRIKGSGVEATKTVPLSGVKRVELQFHGDLYIEVGDQEQLTIAAEDNLLEYIEGVVEDGTLVIRKYPPKGTLETTMSVRYNLTVRELEAITNTDSGNIHAPKMEAAHFAVTIRSSGNVWIESLLAEHLEVILSSSGELTIGSGRVNSQDVTLSSSGNYDARELACRIARARLSSSGEATLNASDRLEADLSSSGNLYYLGNPTIKVAETSSTGRIQRAP